MPFKILPLEEKDCARAAAIETAAFDPDSPVSRVLFSNYRPLGPGEEDPGAESMRVERRSDDSYRGIKVVDTDLLGDGNEDAAIVAMAVWFVVAEPRADGKGPVAIVDHGAASNKEACESFFGNFGRKKQELIGGKPHVYLRLLATDPAHHRRGAGAMLLAWGLAEADRLQLPSYLETTSDGMPLYERHGFREVDTVAQDLTRWGGPKFNVPVMVREPVPVASSS
jgi:GNAT superfamily N-acetyltransferase